MKKALQSLLFLILFAGSELFAQTSSPAKKPQSMCPSADLAALKQQWSGWVAAYASYDLKATMDIFAEDVIFSFQGSPDQHYADLESGYKAEFARARTQREWVPEFEESECSGNLAFVRSTWILRQTDPSGKIEDLTKNRGIDLFRRSKDGKWKIFRSLNYPFNPGT